MTHVCVIAEDRILLSRLGQALRDAGLAVDVVERPGRAVQATATRRYDLMLLDVDSLGDDVAVVEAIRNRSPYTQIVVLSTGDDPPHRVRCLDAGACDFLGMPFDLSELLARIRAQLRRRSGNAAPAQLDATATRLDLLRHELVLADRRIALPPREFLLLQHLMSRAEQVCTRQELLREVWGYDFEADTNVVDKYVSRLRTKVPADLIETIRHVGYTYRSGSAPAGAAPIMTVA